MKKITLLIAGLMVSGLASAATQLTATGQLTLVDCPGTVNSPLLEDVTITLSNGVEAGFACDDAVVVMSACHTAGRTTARSAVVNTPAGCGVGPNPVACTGTTTQQVTGPSFPTASTSGGTVRAEYPVASVTGGCTAGNAETFANTQL